MEAKIIGMENYIYCAKFRERTTYSVYHKASRHDQVLLHTKDLDLPLIDMRSAEVIQNKLLAIISEMRS